MKNIKSTREKARYLLSVFKYKKEDLIQRGIYSISFEGSDKVYIGSATKRHEKWNETGFYIRWRYHLYELENNKHYNPKLQNSFNKYGVDNIRFSIVKIMNNSNNEDILIEEQRIIKELDCVKNGYNCCVKDTFEFYISKGVFPTKKVFVFNFDGTFFKEFNSRADCALFFNISRQKVSHNIKNNRIYQGYLFFNEKEFYIKNKSVYTKHEFDSKLDGVNIDVREIVVYDSNCNSIHSFYNVKTLASFFNISDARNVYLCLNGKIPSTNGLIILYKKDIPNIRIPTKTFCCITDGDVIIKKYPSLLSMSKELGYSEVAIENYLVGKGKKGFIKHEIKRLRLPIEIYDKFLNLIKENEQRETS